MLKRLQADGVGIGIHYPVPVHLQKAYASLGYRPGNFPVTETLANRFLSLPIYAELRPEQVSEVVLKLEKVCRFEAARRDFRLIDITSMKHCEQIRRECRG